MGIFFLFIMQRLSRFYLHGFAGGDADTDGNHQRYQEEADACTCQQTIPFQCGAVSPTVQFGVGKVEIDGEGYRSDDEQQQPTFA